ncbi:hypothetical protein BKA67DRAFT_583708 [Truncatella angustata]|uniref:Uncharacterized protein n=1 Tax=Truncatella angustata TaxID=152316 RepID=A0A9P8UC48_9PEZI|nr:uncharacterized protein BKA67DRAFT_583708 [Truncatella angustata]KAH6646266.1 hypothetical protein BKA67DRAFT_583708 [Truncatella angustata]
MDYLTFLPTELLHSICTFHGNTRLRGSWLLNLKDLTFLMRTHKRLYDIVLPILYKYNRDIDGSTAVLWAAQNGRIDTLERALEFGLNLEVKRPLRADVRRGMGLWRTSIHHAIEHGHIDAVAWLVNHGAQVVGFTGSKVFRAGVRGSSAFHTSLELGRPEIALLLIEKGAAPSVSSSNHNELLPLVAAREMSIARSAVQALGNLDPLASPDVVEWNCRLLIERLTVDFKGQTTCRQEVRSGIVEGMDLPNEATVIQQKPLVPIRIRGDVVMV